MLTLLIDLSCLSLWLLVPPSIASARHDQLIFALADSLHDLLADVEDGVETGVPSRPFRLCHFVVGPSSNLNFD